MLSPCLTRGSFRLLEKKGVYCINISCLVAWGCLVTSGQKLIVSGIVTTRNLERATFDA